MRAFAFAAFVGVVWAAEVTQYDCDSGWRYYYQAIVRHAVTGCPAHSQSYSQYMDLLQSAGAACLARDTACTPACQANINRVLAACAGKKVPHPLP